MKRTPRSWGLLALAAATVLVPLGTSAATAQGARNAPAATFEGGVVPTDIPTAGAQHVGGTRGSVKDFPGIVAGIRAGGTRPEGQTCSATVVNSKKILSAAHCADAQGEKSFVYGLDNLADYKGGSGTGFQFSKVVEYKKHPKYVNFDQGYDVAMVTLASEIKLLNGAAFPTIASSKDTASIIGKTARSYGYGKKDFDDNLKDVTLTYVDFPVVDGDKVCQGVGAGFKSATMICAGYSDGSKTILPGDSGGPLVYDNKIYGVASWSRSDFKWYGVWGRLNNDMGDWAISEAGTPNPGTQDPTIAATPAAVTVEAGKYVSTTITSKAGSTAGENIKLSASGLPSGVTAVFSPTDLKAGDNAKLTFEATTSAAAGTSKVTVSGATAGGKTITTSIDLTVKGNPNPGSFGISLNPSALTVQPGESGSAGLSSTAGSGGAEDIKLTASGLPSGATLTFQPDAIKTGDSAKVRVETTSSTPKGSYSVTITGTNAGGKTATADLKLTVGTATEDFTISVDPAGATLEKGKTVSVGLRSTGSGSITLSASGLPSGVTAEFQPSTINGGESAKVTLSANDTVKTEDVTVTITGTGSAGKTSTAALKLSVKGDGGGNPGGPLAVTLGNSSGSVQQGQMAQVNATFAGGTGNIQVSASGVPGAQFFYNPQSVPQGGTSNIWIFTNFQTPAGTYPVTITGTSADGKTGSATYTLTVTGFGFPGFPMNGNRVAR